MISPYGNVAQPPTLHRFWVGAGVMGAGFVLSWVLRSLPSLWFWGVAITTRLLLLPMAPGSDVWRYLWEGYIQTLGFSPYHFAPNAAALEPYRTGWWAQINHADVTAIYPPLTQLGFWLLAAIAPNLYLFKGAFVIADLLICGLLSQRFGHARTTLYAWNPTIIYAFAGGAHYDSWFLLPLVLAGLMADRELSKQHPLDWLRAAFCVGISVAMKWVSLPIVLFLVGRSLRRCKPAQAVWIGGMGLLPMILSALLYCRGGRCPLIPTDSVFVSYGRSAEFIPHFVAQIWPASLQANWIYAFPLMLFLGWLTLRATSFQQFTEGYWLGLLLLTPIVHFWYFTWVVPFAIATQNWGVRLVSLSAFIYFVLPSRLPNWWLTTPERLFLWLPFLLGWMWTLSVTNSSNPHKKFN